MKQVAIQRTAGCSTSRLVLRQRTAVQLVRPVARITAGSGISHARLLHPLRCAPDESSAAAVTSTNTAEEAVSTPDANGNGMAVAEQQLVAPGVVLSEKSGKQAQDISSVDLELKYEAPSGGDMFWTNFKLAFALPWRRFPKNSVLTIKLEGEISDQAKGRFDSGTSMPQLCAALQKAALDPRVSGLAIEINPISVGYAKLQEIRRYLTYFRQSGKFSIAYIKQGGEKEYYLATACEEVYAPPSAYLSLRGFVVGGTFLRGVLDKVGVEPQVQRIGKFKSAGDQLLRRDMSDEQREQLQSILDDTYSHFVSTVAAARKKTEEEVKELLDAGVYDMADFAKGGWIDGLMYDDELLLDIKKRVGMPENKLDKPLKKVGVQRMASVRASTYAALKGGKKRVVVLRAAGAILGGSSTSTGSSITPKELIPKLRALAQDKNVVGVVLRIDSPGGDAFASDLMWREICQLGEKKPVIASMADVAASGGYFLSMAAHKIVAETLTVTGSIGVVTGKFNLSELYGKVGYAKELLSKGRYAELMADNRPFTEDENELFEKSAQHAYEQFRNKAAASRRLPVDDMQNVAQGRVWTGKEALQRGLVDALGGVHAAVQLVKHAAGMKADEPVTVVELGRTRTSPLTLLRGGASAAMAMLPLAMANPSTFAATLGLLLSPLASSSTAASSATAMVSNSTMDMGLGQAATAAAVSAAAAARVQGAGVGMAVGSELAGALLAAQCCNPASGVSLCVDADALGVQAAGSYAALMAASMPAQGAMLGLPSDDTSFLHEE